MYVYNFILCIMFCCQLLECLEFSKARLFLRQVEVHFHKQPSEIQKIIATMVQWGETQRNYQEVWRTDSTLMTHAIYLKIWRGKKIHSKDIYIYDNYPLQCNYHWDFSFMNIVNASLTSTLATCKYNEHQKKLITSLEWHSLKSTSSKLIIFEYK